jgi:hypothetical protein
LLTKGKKTTNEDAEIQEKRNTLRRRILIWLDVRKIYIPTPPTLINPENSPDNTSTALPELIPLKLPSAMPPSQHALCLFGLVETECRLRLAQAEDALSELRRQLRVTKGLWQFKITQVGPSQRSSTRTRTLINRFQGKTKRCAERYRAARSSLLALDPNGEWQIRLRELNDEDVRCPGKGEDEAEGTRELSWIWRVQRQSAASGSDVPMDSSAISDGDLVEGKLLSELPKTQIYFNL